MYVKESSGKMNNMYEEMENFRKKLKLWGKNQMEILVIKIISDTENSFNGLFGI